MGSVAPQVVQCDGSVHALAWSPMQPLLVVGLKAQVALYTVRAPRPQGSHCACKGLPVQPRGHVVTRVRL